MQDWSGLLLLLLELKISSTLCKKQYLYALEKYLTLSY